jgi:hypothetical protein
MRDDQFFDHENGAAASSDRLDDAPSSEQVCGRNRAREHWGKHLGGLRFWSRHRIDPLRSVPGTSPAGPGSNRIGFQRLVVAGGVLCCLGLAGIAETHYATVDAATDQVASVEVQRRAEADRPASRSERTTEPTPAAAAPTKQAPAADEPSPKATPSGPGPGKRESGPVAGLSEVQMNNAKAIVWTGVDMGMPRRALIIAVATAMQESNLLNRASEVVPESKQYPHQGTGWDHDSVGLFQQRPSAGWGPVRKLMDPAYASQKFYQALVRVPGWQEMRLTDAAQAVQVSAFPEHYAKHEARATKVVDALIEPE